MLRPPCSPTPSIPSHPTQNAIASGLHSIHSVNRASHPFIHSTSQLIQLIHIISYQTHPQLGYSSSPVPSRCCSRVSEALPRVRVASRIADAPHPGRACVRSQPASIAEGRFKHKGAIEAGRTQGARFETDWRSETRDQRKANDERRTVDSGQWTAVQTADRRPQTGRLAERKLVRKGVEKYPSQPALLRTVRVHRGAPTEAHSRGTTVLRERCSVRDKSVI